MSGVADELKNLALAILDPQKGLVQRIPAAQALRDFLEQQAGFCIDDGRDIGAGETRLDSGLAISPTLAAMCLRELFRTPAFACGLHRAILDALHPGRPVRVLYAGCGPYALLALPLMAVLGEQQVKFTLLDIHQECLDSAMALISSFGLAAHVEASLCENAARYRIPADGRPDVIVSETMAVCLRNEPQVSIARNLLAQAPEARMVPQSISVEVCMLDEAKEHVLMPSDYVGEIPAPERDRIYLGKIFELDAARIRSWEGITGDRLPAGRVQVPVRLESRYRPYLLTYITVYGDTCLCDYDCSLTAPQRLPGGANLTGGETLQFYYKLGARPELGYDVSG